MSLVQIPLTVTSPATGAAISGATVTVTIHGGAPAVIYTNDTGTAQLPGASYTTDSGGRAIVGGNPLYLIQGTYDFQVSGGSLTAFTVVRELLSAASSDELSMAGEIKMWGGSAAPTGFLLCNGQSVLRATYPALFAAISTTYGFADGTHFNVPNLQDRFPLGAGSKALAVTGGSLAHVHGMSSHTHSIPALTATVLIANHHHPLSNSGGIEAKLEMGPTGFFMWRHNTNNGPAFNAFNDLTFDLRPTAAAAYNTPNFTSEQGPALCGQTDDAPAGGGGATAASTTGGPSTANTAGADPPYQVVNYIIRHGKLL